MSDKDPAFGTNEDAPALRERIRKALRTPDCGHNHTSWPDEDVRVILREFSAWLDDLADMRWEMAPKIALQYAAVVALKEAKAVSPQEPTERMNDE